jgi:hypothetical protein
MTIVEYLCAGLPVVSLVSNRNIPGLMPETSFNWNDLELKEKLINLFDELSISENRGRFKDQARRIYLDNFSKESWLKAFFLSLDSVEITSSGRKN